MLFNMNILNQHAIELFSIEGRIIKVGFTFELGHATPKTDQDFNLLMVFVDIKIKNDNINSSFVCPERSKDRSYKI